MHSFQEFSARVDQVCPHGLGLSVDVYSPDIGSLLANLTQRQVLPAYLEVFRATTAALRVVRATTALPLTYHGEGLWVTQPKAPEDPRFLDEARLIATDLAVLRSPWSNHECATKQIAGYSFGTYLPPLYTPASASVVARNIRAVQAVFDGSNAQGGPFGPLFLLEMAPLTYFVAGTVPIASYFRRVADEAPCGFVLDVGHLWTVYRYTRARRTQTLHAFVREFVNEFPLERVVEIHVAGLTIHESMNSSTRSAFSDPAGELPLWTDAHAAPIPDVLFEILDHILEQPRLCHLRGLALEVDTKAIDLIGEEFTRFVDRYRSVGMGSAGSAPIGQGREPVARHPESQGADDRGKLESDLVSAYDRYGKVVSGRAEPTTDEWTGPTGCADGVACYRTTYLPFEILHWGGDVEAMFPDTCRELVAREIALASFVTYWFDAPHHAAGSYDFFEIKIDRFLEFVDDVAPDLRSLAYREAGELRDAYHAANEGPLPAVSHPS
ncbi:MAG: DUF692 family protein [Nitrospira sp.]